MSATPTLYRANELGPLLGVSGGTVRRWVREGYIQPTMITPGGQYRFSAEDVRRQIADKGTPAHHPSVNDHGRTA